MYVPFKLAQMLYPWRPLPNRNGSPCVVRIVKAPCSYDYIDTSSGCATLKILHS